MKLRGRRIHIVGSAHPETDEKKLRYVHSLVRELVDALAAEGASFVFPFGKEPLLKDRDDGPAITFDWTIADAVHAALKAGRAHASGPNGRLIATLATSKTDSQIPSSRRVTYDELREADAVHMEFLEPRWNAGAARRRRLAQLGDILIGISGGEGTEHLAMEYSSRGKPVIPLDIKIGGSTDDGSGGAGRLFERALSQPGDFLRVEGGASPADLLDRTRTRDGETETAKVVAAVMKLIGALAAPEVFYVRLLNNKHPDFAAVETFFRDVVDPFVIDLGYKPSEMGLGKNEFAWMNQAIFDSIHRSAVVLVDLTGLRPNCFMEFGFALGNKQKVIIIAKEGTDFPFDSSSLEAFLWPEAGTSSERIDRLRKHWERNIDMPPIVSPKVAR
jgi:hypothetical protein